MARGRRVNSSGEKSKQLLLEKAIELFSIHGYHQTKISDIVKAANLTQPTFYLYFQSKESIFKDLNTDFKNRLYEIFNNGLTQTIHDEKCVRTQLTENLKQIFCYFVENPNLTKCLSSKGIRLAVRQSKPVSVNFSLFYRSGVNRSTSRKRD